MAPEKEQDVVDALDDWLGLPNPDRPKKNGAAAAEAERTRRLDVSKAIDFLERGGMAEAQAALGLLCIAQAGKDILAGGLTQEALTLLIQASVGYVKGNLVATSTIQKILDAVAALDRYVDKESLAKVLAVQRKRGAK